MFDRDLSQWYRELFFSPQVSGARADQPLDGAMVWGVPPVDASDRPVPQWFTGRKTRMRCRMERTDLK
jgi:hypothetical protein